MVVFVDDVLRPLEPPIRDDVSQWPEFALKRATVFSQATNQPVSLLAAHGYFRVRVEGILEEVDEDDVHLGIPHFSKRVVQVDEVS